MTGLITFKQIDTTIKSAEKESKEWFNRIEDIVKEKNPNIKLSTKVILTRVSIYGEKIHYAKKENTDLIVISTRGRSGFKKILLGSTALGVVVTYANCPVLVTK